MGSTRLPGKVLLDLSGATVLERCLERVRRFKHVSEVVVATSDRIQDDVIVALCQRLGFRFYRGDENDVLKRYVGAAREAKADVIVRCTSDCPLLDPEMSSQVIEQFLTLRADYVSNTLQRFLPRGLDTEVFSRDALEKANQYATQPEEREHVTLRMYRSFSEFSCKHISYEGFHDFSSYRWTLDTVEDYCFLASVFNKLGPNSCFASMSDILDILEKNPGLTLINSQVRQKNV